MLLLSLFVVFVVADDSHTTHFVSERPIILRDGMGFLEKPGQPELPVDSYNLPCVQSDDVGMAYGACSSTSFRQWFSNTCSDKGASFTTSQVGTNSITFRSLELSPASFGSNENLYFSDPLENCEWIHTNLVCGIREPHDLVLRGCVEIRDYYLNTTNGWCSCPDGYCIDQFVLVNNCEFNVGVQVVSSVIGSPTDYIVNWYKLAPKDCSVSGTDAPPNILFLGSYPLCELEKYSNPSITAVVSL
jgi:hypothetical protein